MKHLIMAALVSVSLVACGTPSPTPTPPPAGNTPVVPPVTQTTPPTRPAPATAVTTAEEAGIRSLVENFGKRLQTVSLLAPDAAQELQQQYADFVAPALLETWTKDVTQAPGRIVSSPWPDQIDIITLSKEGSDRYVMTGSVIEITSVELVNGGAAARRPVHMVVQREQGRWLITTYAEEP